MLLIIGEGRAPKKVCSEILFTVYQAKVVATELQFQPRCPLRTPVTHPRFYVTVATSQMALS